MGTLSGLKTIRRKSLSSRPTKKNKTRPNITVISPPLVQSKFNFNLLFHLSNQSFTGKKNGKLNMAKVSISVGRVIKLIRSLKPSI